MNTEQKQRIEQIQERASNDDANNWYRQQAFPWIEAQKDIDFLLSLVKSQEAEAGRLRRGLESIRDCTSDMWSCSMAEQTLNGSSFEDAVAASKQYDTEEGFDAATSMRSRCVEKVKAMRDEWRNDPQGDWDEEYADAADKIVTALESVSIQEPE